MLSIHDAECRESLLARIDALTTDSTRRWGKMTVDQMLWHLNASLSLGLGKLQADMMRLPLPRAVLKFGALYLPFPRGRVQAIPVTVARQRYDLQTERGRVHALAEEFARVPLDAPWPDHPIVGTLSGRGWSRLQAKHAEYHLTQFGA